MEVTLSLILSAMVFKVSRVETKPIDGQKPGTSGLLKKVVNEKIIQQPNGAMWDRMMGLHSHPALTKRLLCSCGVKLFSYFCNSGGEDHSDVT
uniref:Uncharacterized protein n=1 Tax=Quercus lobata TaxID=97700 RepID=A0A7N2MUM7_QUELO